MSITDIIIDSLFEEDLQGALKTLGAGRLVPDSKDPDQPFLTEDDGYLVVRVRDRDPHVFARELERRVSWMRIVTVVDRTPKE